MKRQFEEHLTHWINSRHRKPLVLRGARQVGKTWLVRRLGTITGKDLVELNFEKDPFAQDFFKSNNPQDIINEISLYQNRRIDPEKTILFLDEIQAAGEILSTLRWFAEDMPQLPVIAAGSLLEFTLEDHKFSMPVGRITFLNVEPMGYFEYLEAHKQTIILENLHSWCFERPFSSSLHNQALKWFQRFCMTGGMPEIVQADVEEKNGEECRDIQNNLYATYRADFAKYRKRIDSHILDKALLAICHSVGEKFVYSKINNSIKHYQAKQAIQMLTQARLCHTIYHSCANGLPLGGEIKEKSQKIILNDISLFHAMVKTPAKSSYPQWDTITNHIRGRMVEQISGQLLRLLGPFSGDGPSLYYWQRGGGRPGEIDYLIQSQSLPVPVEIKSGSSGAMKSLHQFMFDKKLPFALRLDSNPPSSQNIDIKTTRGNRVTYRLQNIPVYMAEKIGTLIASQNQ